MTIYMISKSKQLQNKNTTQKSMMCFKLPLPDKKHYTNYLCDSIIQPGQESN